MRKLYDLRKKLCDQLEDYSDKELNSTTLEIVDMLAHAIKNVDKVIDKCEEQEYSNSYGYGSYRSPYTMYNDMVAGRGMPYSRDRGMRGNSVQGYSRDNDLIFSLTELMENAPDDRSRMELQKFIQKMQSI